jgi:hypothetical protein
MDAKVPEMNKSCKQAATKPLPYESLNDELMQKPENLSSF